MFSGIIEATSSLAAFTLKSGAAEVQIVRPNDFNDLRLGDSISVDGVCLTVEAMDEQTVQFTLAAETLQVTGWNPENWGKLKVNLERSLRLGDRIHGHLVTGHVDAMGEVLGHTYNGESLILTVKYPEALDQLIWPKGSVALNGVSLTVNQVEAGCFQVCLIPETLRRTNLSLLRVGDKVTIEVDNLARGLLKQQAAARVSQ